MPLVSKITIQGNKNAVITVGESNIISVSQKLSEANEQSLTNQAGEWAKVVSELKGIQHTVKGLDDEHEELRDQVLVPTISKAKKQAEALEKDPNSDKRSFVESFKSFCDAALKA